MPASLKHNKRTRPTGAMVTVTNAVDASKIREETDEYGDTIIIVPSYTLPDDVVMNRGFYPKEEIEASYTSLDGTPAPLSHPVTKSGDFISASSEIGVHNFQCGIFNGNVSRENGRVYVEKRINKRVAMQSERGKRVLDRIEAFMKGEGDPIHTSTGIFLDMEMLEKPMTNASGEEYDWIARNLYFDHDAVLLDEEGAATPDKGVGMMVNSKLHTNLDNSENDKRDALNKAVQEEFADDDSYAYVVDYDDDQLVFENKEGYYQIGYTLSDDGEVQFVGELTEVKRKTMWQAIANWFGSICGNSSDQLHLTQCGRGGRILANLNEGNDMSIRQKLIDQLKANKVELDYENVTDEQLLDAVNKAATNEAEEELTPAPAVEPDDKVLEAVNALTTKVTELETKLNAKEEDEIKAMRDYLKDKGDYEDGEVDDMGNKAVKAAYKRMKGNAQEAPAFFPGAAGDFAANSNDADLYGKMPNEEV